MVSDYLGEFDQCSQSCVIVAIRTGVENLTANFSVQFSDKVVRCSCGYFEDVKSTCVHAIFALKHSCKMASMIDYFHDSWKSSKFMDAYSEKAKTNIRPIVVKYLLTRGCAMLHRL